MPVRELVSEGLEVMGLFYNPNIQPLTEHRRRRQTLQDWARTQDLALIVQDDYDPQEWFRQVAFRESQRCALCYHQRLGRAARVARRGGFDAFSTTLLYSVRQKHELIAEAAREAARQAGVEFLYRDWRPTWREGIRRSQELGLYRQDYCGCLYSEHERHRGRLPRPSEEISNHGSR
jgi:hypothetical protein